MLETLQWIPKDEKKFQGDREHKASHTVTQTHMRVVRRESILILGPKLKLPPRSLCTLLIWPTVVPRPPPHPQKKRKPVTSGLDLCLRLANLCISP